MGECMLCTIKTRQNLQMSRTATIRVYMRQDSISRSCPVVYKLILLPGQMRRLFEFPTLNAVQCMPEKSTL